MKLAQLLAAGAPPVIAILRGVQPTEVVEIGRALVDAGIRIIEVPLNCFQPLLSIERLSAALPQEVLVGAGTVTSVAAVNAVAASGARFIVAPNTDGGVITRSVELDLDVIPGVMTPSEAFAAFTAGARHLKLFPAATVGTKHLEALLDVLPPECGIWAVGGTNAANFGSWLEAGAIGIGVGGALYSAGTSAAVVQQRAAQLVTQWRDSQLA